MGESFLKALLHDVLGVFARAGDAPRNEQNLLLVTFDESLERVPIAVLRGSDEHRVWVAGKAFDRTNRGTLFVDVVAEFGWHSSTP